jgi:hypothetical protein
MDAEQALTTGLGLKQRDWKILIRVGWVLVVTFHMGYVLGVFAVAGFASPFAKASDVDKLLRASVVSTRLQIQTELRAQKVAYCRETDFELKQSFSRRYDELRGDLRDIANVEWPELTCPTAQ